MTTVTGADARPGAWVSVSLKDGCLETMERHRSFDALLATVAAAEVIAVDVPLGHDDPDGTRSGGRRACDAAARAFLGPASGRVGWVPPPPVFACADLDRARALAQEAGWPEPTARLWSLRDRVGEAQAAASTDPRIVEMHPEVSFHALLRERTAALHFQRPDASWRGLAERLGLLHGVGLRPTRSFGGIGLVTPQDVLDATIAAWTAARVAAGVAGRFPAEGPVAIHY